MQRRQGDHYCLMVNPESTGTSTVFDWAATWRFKTREAAEGACLALNWLLGHERFVVGQGAECAPALVQ
jgi:hypothetical protein